MNAFNLGSIERTMDGKIGQTDKRNEQSDALRDGQKDKRRTDEQTDRQTDG